MRCMLLYVVIYTIQQKNTTTTVSASVAWTARCPRSAQSAARCRRGSARKARDRRGAGRDRPGSGLVERRQPAKTGKSGQFAARWRTGVGGRRRKTRSFVYRVQRREAGPTGRELASGRRLERKAVQNGLQGVFSRSARARAGQRSENAATGVMRGRKALFNARCQSRKASPFLFWSTLKGCAPRTVLHGALARPVERPARP